VADVPPPLPPSHARAPGDDASPPRPPAGPAGRTPTPPFVWAAVVLALLAGFGLGTALFYLPPGVERVVAAQAHGHVQVFGWAGLLVLGVGLHFLPRLRGGHLAAPGLAPWVLGLYATGLALRALTQPLAPYAPALWPLLPLSGALELAGATLAVGMLLATMWHGPALAERSALAPVVPYLALAFGSFWVALALNLVGLAALAPPAGGVAWAPLVGGPEQPLLVHLGLVGFLVPICLAVSVRTFPLYLRVRVPATRGLGLAFALLVAGLALRLAAVLGGWLVAESGGWLLEGCALLVAAWALDVPVVRSRAGVLAETQRRAAAYGTPPRSPPPLSGELLAAEWLLRTAYAWLVVVAALMVAGGLALLVGAAPPPLDAERHALGAGFVTLLIFGMGVRLLPGFVGRGHVASSRLAWLTLWLGNAAALLRVVPLLVAWLLGASAGGGAFQHTMGLAGALDLIAVACFGWNLWRTLR
jgi:uncharacterized protein involved in response to NO